MSIAIDTRHVPLGAMAKNKLLIFGKFLSNPIRVDIADLLMSEGELRPTDIATKLGEPPANISYHLWEMRGEGHLITEKRGREVYYSVAPKTADVLLATTAV